VDLPEPRNGSSFVGLGGKELTPGLQGGSASAQACEISFAGNVMDAYGNGEHLSGADPSEVVLNVGGSGEVLFGDSRGLGPQENSSDAGESMDEELDRPMFTVMGKPNVLEMKTVTTNLPSGKPCRVMAQLYGVLVTGVPKIERRRCGCPPTYSSTLLFLILSSPHTLLALLASGDPASCDATLKRFMWVSLCHPAC
jgi:hypothetical protein